MSANLKNERAIILRTLKCGESDLVVHGLNGEGHRIHLLAKGALRSRRRFGGGVLEPLNYVQVSYRLREEKDEDEPLHWLNEAQLLKDFQGLRTDFDRLELGIYFLQLASKVGRAGDLHNSALFDILGNSLHSLETSAKIKSLRLLFELKVLHQQGVLDHHSQGAYLVSVPIRDHEQIDLSDHLYLNIKRDTQQLLDAYMG